MKIFQLNIPNSRTIKFQLYRRTKNDFHDSHYKLKTFPKLDSKTPSKRSNTKSIHRHKKHKKNRKNRPLISRIAVEVGTQHFYSASSAL